MFSFSIRFERNFLSVCHSTQILVVFVSGEKHRHSRVERPNASVCAPSKRFSRLGFAQVAAFCSPAAAAAPLELKSQSLTEGGRQRRLCVLVSETQSILTHNPRRPIRPTDPTNRRACAVYEENAWAYCSPKPPLFI